jgi:hypothetical protein
MPGQPFVVDTPSFYKPVPVSPFARPMDAHMAYGSQLATLGQLSAGGAQHLGGQFFAGQVGSRAGSFMGAALGGTIGGSIAGPLGALEGAWTGWDLGGMAGGPMLSSMPFFSNMAGRMMRPAIERVADQSRLRGMTQNFVHSGSELGLSGRGIDNTSSLLSGVSGLASANHLTRQDVLNVMSTAGAEGLFSSSQDTDKLLRTTKDLLGVIGAVAKLTGDPDFRKNIESIAQLKRSGVSLTDVPRALRELEDLSRTGGVDLQTMMSTSGALGAQVGQTMGLAPITGIQMGAGFGAISRQMMATGILGDREKAMLGGQSGLTQRMTQAGMGFWASNYDRMMPYLLEQQGTGFGINKQRLSDLTSGRISMNDLIGTGASNLSSPDAIQDVLANKDKYLDEIMSQTGSRGTMKAMRADMDRVMSMGTGLSRHHAMKIVLGGNADDATVRSTLKMLDSPELQRGLVDQDIASMRHQLFENQQFQLEQQANQADYGSRTSKFGRGVRGVFSPIGDTWDRFQTRGADQLANSTRAEELAQLGYAPIGMKSGPGSAFSRIAGQKTVEVGADGVARLVETGGLSAGDDAAMRYSRGEGRQLRDGYADIRDNMRDLAEDKSFAGRSLYHGARFMGGLSETALGAGAFFLPGKGLDTQARAFGLASSTATYGVGDRTLDAINTSDRSDWYRQTRGSAVGDMFRGVGSRVEFLGSDWMQEDAQEILRSVKKDSPMVTGAASATFDQQLQGAEELIEMLKKQGLSDAAARRFVAQAGMRVRGKGSKWYSSELKMNNADDLLAGALSNLEGFTEGEMAGIHSVVRGKGRGGQLFLQTAAGTDSGVQRMLTNTAQENNQILAASAQDDRSATTLSSTMSADDALGSFGLGDTNTATDDEKAVRDLLMGLSKDDAMALLLMASASDGNKYTLGRLTEYLSISDPEESKRRRSAVNRMRRLFDGLGEAQRTKLKKVANSGFKYITMDNITSPEAGLYTNVESSDSLSARLDNLMNAKGDLSSKDLDRLVTSTGTGATTATGLIEMYRSASAERKGQIRSKAGALLPSLNMIDEGSGDDAVRLSMLNAASSPSAEVMDVTGNTVPGTADTQKVRDELFTAQQESAKLWSGVGSQFGKTVTRLSTVIDRWEKAQWPTSKPDASVANEANKVIPKER